MDPLEGIKTILDALEMQTQLSKGLLEAMSELGARYFELKRRVEELEAQVARLQKGMLDKASHLY